jgi:hypothetical protein
MINRSDLGTEYSWSSPYNINKIAHYVKSQGPFRYLIYETSSPSPSAQVTTHFDPITSHFSSLILAASQCAAPPPAALQSPPWRLTRQLCIAGRPPDNAPPSLTLSLAPPISSTFQLCLHGRNDWATYAQDEAACEQRLDGLQIISIEMPELPQNRCCSVESMTEPKL